jgi:hypothetical protein
VRSPEQRRRANSLAIISPIFAFLWLFSLGSWLAVLFGAIAIYQIKRSRGAQYGMTMAVVGIALGLAGIALYYYIAFGPAKSGY